MTKHQKYMLSEMKKHGEYVEICNEKDLPKPPPKFYWLRKRNVFQEFFNQWTPKWSLQQGEWSWRDKITL